MATRRRPRAGFQASLPLKVVPAELDSDELEAVIQLLGPQDGEARESIRSRLLRLATDYQHSRKLEAAGASRPEARMCLREIVKCAGNLISAIDALRPESACELHQELSFLTRPECATGVEALHRTADLLDELSFAAETLFRRYSAAPSRAECRDVLNQIKVVTVLTFNRLQSLPLKSEWELVLVQQSAPFMPEGGKKWGLDLVRQLLVNLAVIAGTAFELSKSERGPKSDTTQMLAVKDLHQIFRAATGRRAAHSAKVGRHYSGRTESEFGKFAWMAMRLIDPDFRNRRGVIEAISFVSWPSRYCGRAAKVTGQRESRELRTAEILGRLSVTNFSPPRANVTP